MKSILQFLYLGQATFYQDRMNEEKATVNPRNEEGEIDHSSSKVISEIYCSKMIYRQF